MTKTFYNLLVAAVATVLFAACTKDTGNYDYSDPNNVSFEGIEESYVALLGERFVINPELKFTLDNSGDTSRYEYEWIALRTDNVLPADIRKNLAYSKNLDIIMTAPPGPYKVYYRVKDKETGIQFSTTFALTVQSSVYEGWLLLCDENGKSRLDMVSVVNTDSARVLKDILTTLDAGVPAKYTSSPNMVHCYSFDPTYYGIYISSNEATTKVNPESFQWSTTNDISYEFLSNLPEKTPVDYMSNITANTAYYHTADGNVYYYYRVYQTKPSTPVNLVSGELAVSPISKYMATCRIGVNSYALMFDTKNRRFIRHGNNEAVAKLMPAGTLFDYDSVGMDLVWMKYTGYNSGEAFAVMQHPETKERHLARVSLTSTIVQRYFAKIEGTDIDKAENFGVSPDYGYLFYNVGSKVYSYDFNLKTSKLMLDLGSRKISTLGFHDFAATKYAVLKTKLVVASYEESNPGTSGSFDLYTVAPVQGDLKTYRSYNGVGKVVSLSYRER